MNKIIASTAVLLLGAFAFAQATSDRNLVTITLLDEVVLDDAVIHLDQIAKLSGGSVALRQRLARLDIAEFKLSVPKTWVASDQIRFRLMLAGIPAGQFQLAGAKRTLVAESEEPITARKLRAFAEREMRTRYPSSGPSREIIAPLLDLRGSDRVQLEATRVVAGRVDIAIIVNGKTREIVGVPFDAEARSTPVRTPVVEPRTVVPVQQSEVVIKARDLVKIIAVIGPAQVVASGEAQQDGKVGEIIRVRNVESSRTVSGRVESAGVVVVDY